MRKWVGKLVERSSGRGGGGGGGGTDAGGIDTTSESSGQSSSQRKSWICGWKRGDLSWRKLDKQKLADEISGSLGDLGSYIPVVIALAMVNGLDLGTTIFFSGFFNILTGLIFGVPMPVQPMQAIAAAAIEPGQVMSIPQMMAAGLSVSFILLFLSVTGLIGFVNWLVPLPVVRGVQLCQGLSFALTGVKYVLREQNFGQVRNVGLPRPWLGLDGRMLAIAAFCFVVGVTGVGGDHRPTTPALKQDVESGTLQPSAPTDPSGAGGEDDGTTTTATVGTGADTGKRKGSMAKLPWKRAGVYLRDARGKFAIPTGLLLVVLGMLLAFARMPSIFKALRVGPSRPRVVHIKLQDWKVGFNRAAVQQLPLSVLNSVIATVKLGHDLFPAQQGRLTVARVAASVGLMNVLGCWFGAMPVCHGASGLAAQYRLGARTGLSVLMLGGIKMLVSLFLGSSILRLLLQFPVALLGVLLLLAGLELAIAARDQASRSDAFVTFLVAVVGLAWSNGALGFACGMMIAWILKVRNLDLDLLDLPTLDPAAMHAHLSAAPLPPHISPR